MIRYEYPKAGLTDMRRIEYAMRALLIAIMPLGTIVVAVLMIVIARLLLLERLLRRIAGGLLRLNAKFVALVVAELVAVASIGAAKRVRASCPAIAERIDTALLRHLFAIAQDDAVIMFGVLQIIFRQHRIAGRQRIARQRNVLFRDVRGGTADLHIRTRALEAAHQGIL